MNTISKAVKMKMSWVARIASIISIGIILLFFIGEGFIPAQLTLNEWLGFIFFPLGIVVGMVVAWWREGVGGFITLGSLILFYLVHFLTAGTFPKGFAWIAFTSPGILFLASWLIQSKMQASDK